MYTESEKLVTAYTGMDGHKDTAFAKIKYKVKEKANGNATITLKNITISNTLGEKSIISNNVTKVVTVSEAASESTSKTLSSIEITTKPNKVTYTEGENFDKTGMVITATYSDGTKRKVTNYTYTPNGALSTQDTEITISYTEGSVTKKAKQKITVTKTSTNTGNTGSSNGSTTNGSLSKKDSTVVNQKIPQLGIISYLGFGIIAIAIIGTISYIKYKKYKEI